MEMETDKHNNQEIETLNAPVRFLKGESAKDAPQEGIALCLSGGGYRAMLFHVGVLWRLNEVGLLPKLNRISSVSGGSITAGVLALNWHQLNFNNEGIARNFDNLVVAPVRKFANVSIDISSVVRGALLPGSISEKVCDTYREHLFGDKTLQDLPDTPHFIFNATNVQSKVLWRFTKAYMRDYRVGEVKHPRIELAEAVTASSAFPPFLSPFVLKLEEAQYTPDSGTDLQHPPYTTEVVLTDGGVYDNLGLETAWKKYKTILVSDAGGTQADDPEPSRLWGLHTLRVLNLIDSQVRALRKRQVISSFTDGTRQGAYWGIRSDIADFHLPDALPAPPNQTLQLANIPTRLTALDEVLQERLINWGYSICDAGVRRHLNRNLAAPTDYPYPQSAVG